jgi:hypothetical protein
MRLFLSGASSVTGFSALNTGYLRATIALKLRKPKHQETNLRLSNTRLRSRLLDD